jgi:hypothetical protein
MRNQPLLLELGEDRQWFFKLSVRRLQESPNAKIDYIQPVDREVSKIVVNAIDQFLARKCGNPGFAFTPGRT